ncbi:MAG TPA: DUF4870 domain-containing protein [Candidatus Acidoferrales bacterium]|nr:DUF4870 domain-containing protein [Candidatus Acidoferrales bacterium]
MGEAEKLVPDSDERMYACLAHFLQMIGGFIGPLIIFLVKRESRFVAFHAVQALLWQVVMVIGWIVAMLLFFSLFFATMAGAGTKPPPGPPPAFFILFPLIWLAAMSGWVVTLILAIVYGVKSMRGEWAAYPLIGRWARRLVGV